MAPLLTSTGNASSGRDTPSATNTAVPTLVELLSAVTKHEKSQADAAFKAAIQAILDVEQEAKPLPSTELTNSRSLPFGSRRPVFKRQSSRKQPGSEALVAASPMPSPTPSPKSAASQLTQSTPSKQVPVSAVHRQLAELVQSTCTAYKQQLKSGSAAQISHNTIYKQLQVAQRAMQSLECSADVSTIASAVNDVIARLVGLDGQTSILHDEEHKEPESIAASSPASAVAHLLLLMATLCRCIQLLAHQSSVQSSAKSATASKFLLHAVKLLQQLVTSSTSGSQLKMSYVVAIRQLVLPTLCSTLSHMHASVTPTGVDLLSHLYLHSHHFCTMEFELIFNDILLPILQQPQSNSLSYLQLQHAVLKFFHNTLLVSDTALQRVYVQHDLHRTAKHRGVVQQLLKLLVQMQSATSRVPSSLSSTIPQLRIRHHSRQEAVQASYQSTHSLPASTAANPTTTSASANTATQLASLVMDFATIGIASTTTADSSSNVNQLLQQQSEVRHSAWLLLARLNELLLQSSSQNQTRHDSDHEDEGTDAIASTNYASHLSQQRQTEDFHVQAIQVFNANGFKQLVSFIQTKDQQYKNVVSIAHWLYTNHQQLDAQELGEFLAQSDDKLFTAVQYITLRSTYVHCFNFTALNFVAALRLYLTQCGFRLPGEAQKIDRLLDIFCSVYVECNPAVWRSSSTAFVIAFALVMLNTDLHDKRLSAQTSNSTAQRQSMTVEQFISNLRGVTDDGQELNQAYLKEMYHAIQNEEIQWKAAQTDAPTVSVLTPQQHLAQCLQRYRNGHHQQALQFTLPQSSLRVDSEAMRMLTVQVCKSSYDAMMLKLQSVTDVDSLKQCVDLLITAAMNTQSVRELVTFKALVNALAMITYQYQQNGQRNAVEEPSTADAANATRSDVRVSFDSQLRSAYQNKEHQKQPWHNKLIVQFNDRLATSKGLTDVQAGLHNHIQAEQRVLRLVKLQTDFGNELKLVRLTSSTDSDAVKPQQRYLLKHAVLQRLRLDRKPLKTSPIFAFLLSDQLLLASEGIQTAYKLIRSVPLQLVRLHDVQVGSTSRDLQYVLEVVTPVKSIVLTFDTEQAKAQWMQLLRDTIQSKLAAPFPAVSIISSAAASTCHLCQRVYTMFRRKHQCDQCHLTVCAECRSQRIADTNISNASLNKSMRSPNTDAQNSRKICDMCYARHTGHITEQTPIVTSQSHTGQCKRPCEWCDIR